MEPGLPSISFNEKDPLLISCKAVPTPFFNIAYFLPKLNMIASHLPGCIIKSYGLLVIKGMIKVLYIYIPVTL
jgi:hypothetical protein